MSSKDVGTFVSVPSVMNCPSSIAFRTAAVAAGQCSTRSLTINPRMVMRCEMISKWFLRSTGSVDSYPAIAPHLGKQLGGFRGRR